MTKVFIGVDPGWEGAGVAIFEYEGESSYGVEAVLNSLPFEQQREWYQKWNKDAVACYVEKVNGRGGWSATNNFSFGRSYQSCLDATCHLDVEIIDVLPKEWQGHYGLVGCVDGKAKNKTTLKKQKHREKIEELFTTDFKITNKTVDAFLIAYYGLLKYYGEI